jgi:HlyD family secretion protein
MNTKTLRLPLLLAGVLIVAVSLAAAVMSSRAAPPMPVPSVPARDSITSLGRISPANAVIRLSARSISGQPSLVSELLVDRGDLVQRGQILAVLNSRDQLDAHLRHAVASLAVAERRLAQVKAGVKPADLSAQRAEIARVEAELATSRTELRRYEALKEAALIADSELDRRQLAVEATALQLRQATERLNSLAEVRDVDIALAEAEVASATTNVRLARTQYEQAEVRSPIDGRVVEIHTWPGEEVKSTGIMELAATDPMYVVAEVADRDIARVRVGQRATVTGEALSAPLEGVVERIATKMAKNDLLQVDPTAPSDARVFETWIRLDAPGQAAGLIHAEVTVRITP